MSEESGFDKLRKIVNEHQFEHEESELPGLTAADLLRNYTWAESVIKDITEARGLAENEKDKNAAEEYLNEMSVYLNKLHKEFDRRKTDIPN